jgi:hypothetical protein
MTGENEMNSALKTQAKTGKTEALSTLTKALEQAHEIIKQETGAPRVTILVTRDLKGRKGHFTHFQPWHANGEAFNEIAFNLEHFTNAKELLSTLIHEVAHSLNYSNGIQDTSANQYHNAKFKAQAEALGLKTIEIKGKGHAATELTEFGAKRWKKALSILEKALELTALSNEGNAKPKGRNTNLLKAVCQCDEPKTIRASRGVIDSGIRCDECQMRFSTED